MVHQTDVYNRIGEDGFRRVVAAFYEQIPSDNLLGPLYPQDDLEGAEQRLRDFLVGRFGGPQRYIEQRGHPKLRMRHMHFPIDQARRDRWFELMNNALTTAAIPEDVAEVLRPFFADSATFLINAGATDT